MARTEVTCPSCRRRCAVPHARRPARIACLCGREVLYSPLTPEAPPTRFTYLEVD